MNKVIDLSIGELIDVYEKHQCDVYICHSIISEFVGWGNVFEFHSEFKLILNETLMKFVYDNLVGTEWVDGVDASLIERFSSLDQWLNQEIVNRYYWGNDGCINLRIDVLKAIREKKPDARFRVEL